MVETIEAVKKLRQNRPTFQEEAQRSAPDIYIVKGSVPARSLTDPPEAGSAILPVYRLLQTTTDGPWEILPLTLNTGGTPFELEVFNVRSTAVIDDFHYARRDKFGRWQIDDPGTTLVRGVLDVPMQRNGTVLMTRLDGRQQAVEDTDQISANTELNAGNSVTAEAGDVDNAGILVGYDCDNVTIVSPNIVTDSAAVVITDSGSPISIV